MTDSSKPISRRLRFEILKRDGYACRYCGATAPDAKLTVDHVIPVALGGGDDPTNLVTACQPCNAGKSSSSPDDAIVQDVDAAALLWAKAMEKATELRRGAFASLSALLDGFEADWNTWNFGDGQTVPLPRDWRASVERFLLNGLDPEELTELVRTAMETPSVRDPFRFFCKRCWNELSSRQELARRLLEDNEV